MAEITPFLSVVIPIYRGEKFLLELYVRLVTVLEPMGEFEIIFVEDCGGDRSYEIITELAEKDPRIRGIQFSRNFGQHYGITAGLDASRGEWTVVMDGDLQDKPEDIPKFLEKTKDGFDIVLGRRVLRKDGLLQRLSSKIFYTFFNYMTGSNYDPSVAGFSILSRKAVAAFVSLREEGRFYISIIQWIGFPTGYVEVDHGSREDGKSGYTFKKRLTLGINVMMSYSNRPLILMTKIGFYLSAVSFIIGATMIFLWAMGKMEVRGWASLIVSIYFFSGLLMMNLGILGVYVGKILDQQKNRPLYIIRNRTDKY